MTQAPEQTSHQTDLAHLTQAVLRAVAAGQDERSGPLPAGGPETVANRTKIALGTLLPEHGNNPTDVLTVLANALSWGSADPNHPHCLAHLHCPPAPESVAADLAVNILNPSLDSWDQAPAASEIEKAVCATISSLVYPNTPTADSVITTGGTESNLVALLIAREKLGAHTRVVTSTMRHHSIDRACMILGMKTPDTIPTHDGIINIHDLEHYLNTTTSDPDSDPVIVAITAGTTDEGMIDPLHPIADLCARYGAHLHVDAAYGGMVLCSRTWAHLLDGLSRADSITLDCHKLCWQPIAASALVVREQPLLAPLRIQADYLNADDDTAAGIPDVLDRSIRTSRRLDAFKLAALFKSRGRAGIEHDIDHCIAMAHYLRDQLDAHPDFERPLTTNGLSTVLFRPTNLDNPDMTTAAIRRYLLHNGLVVLGRATRDDGTVWLKSTILNPHITRENIDQLIATVHQATQKICNQTPH